MRRSLIRIIAFLLIPGLLADSVTAFGSTACGLPRTASQPLPFETQALTLRFAASAPLGVAAYLHSAFSYMTRLLAPISHPAVDTDNATQFIEVMNQIKASMEDNRRAVLDLEKWGVRLGVNGVALRYILTDQTVLFIGRGSTGKAASAYHMIEGIPSGVEKGTWELVAHWIGQMLFANHQADQIFYMQHPEYETQGLAWTRVQRENGTLYSSVEHTDIRPAQSAFQVNALVLFSSHRDVSQPTIELTQPNSPSRKQFIDLLIETFPVYDHVNETLNGLDLLGQHSVPMFIVRIPENLIDNKYFQILVRDIHRHLDKLFRSALQRQTSILRRAA